MDAHSISNNRWGTTQTVFQTLGKYNLGDLMGTSMQGRKPIDQGQGCCIIVLIKINGKKNNFRMAQDIFLFGGISIPYTIKLHMFLCYMYQ